MAKPKELEELEVIALGGDLFQVKNLGKGTQYLVRVDGLRRSCDCPARVTCKHIRAVNRHRAQMALQDSMRSPSNALPTTPQGELPLMPPEPIGDRESPRPPSRNGSGDLPCLDLSQHIRAAKGELPLMPPEPIGDRESPRPPSRNGDDPQSGASRSQTNVISFEERGERRQISAVIEELKKPFAPHEHDIRDLPGGGKWLYIPWQHIRDRLNRVCPSWQVVVEDPKICDRYCVVGCTLTIYGVSRRTTGQADLNRAGFGTFIEAAIADALKNAAELFGVAAYIDNQVWTAKYLNEKGDYRGNSVLAYNRDKERRRSRTG